jgi:hypothetical protein
MLNTVFCVEAFSELNSSYIGRPPLPLFFGRPGEKPLFRMFSVQPHMLQELLSSAFTGVDLLLRAAFVESRAGSRRTIDRASGEMGGI